ncbi:chemotaxis protein CheD [Desulfobacula toluolica]|uniref:Probable chemoreceptor glutamine deamidase CheD n=1 Tax=Desulfobacula toluolica (strain DSM 7467 / Tol2) TaxID=651182 RepID=K0NL56_DESTT|nr:chemotaxis protein CheD [Desulfobacula toluolica]CCK81495.1 CheD2: predicted chemoreceptor glutamine deamidase [Desulfobacula toluolica Tol2]
MTQNSEKQVTKDYFLKPGYIYLPDRPTTISTVLGSSVAVSLYDKSLKAGGMNHFLFPYIETRKKTTAKYGNIAVLTLIRMMAANGSDISNLEAQLFGGAFNPEYSKKDIGKDNLKTARHILSGKKIKIVSEDIGGELGRKIVFNTGTYEIAILKVDRLRESDWYPYSGDR